MQTSAIACLLLGIALSSTPAQANDSAHSAYTELLESFDRTMRDWELKRAAAFKRARELRERPPKSALTPPTQEFMAKAQKLAEEHAGTNAAAPLLGLVIKTVSTHARYAGIRDSDRQAARRALDALQAKHAKSAMIGDVIQAGLYDDCSRLGHRDAATALIESVAAHHPDPKCRAQALLTRGLRRVREGRLKGGGEDLTKVMSLTTNKSLVAAAEEALRIVTRLGVGASAPEIEGVDTNGDALKLSDFRGKVVLLHFWGFW